MTENFEAEVCGGSNWPWPWQWHPSLGLLFTSSSSSSSPSCSSNFDNMVGGFGLFNPEFLGNKAWSSDESTGSPAQPVPNNSSIDSTSQILGIGISSSMATDWNPTLLQGNGSSEAMNYTEHMIQQEDQEASRMNDFESVINNNNNDFSLIQKPRINSLSNTNTSPSSDQSLTNNLPIINTGHYGNYTSDLLQINLFENEPQTKQPLYDTSKFMNDYEATLNEFSRNSFSELSSNSSMEKQKPTNNLLELSANNTDFCNESSANIALGPQFFPSPTNYGKRPNLPNFKAMNQNDEREGLGTVTKKSNNEATFKRPRIETPTPLPTFKVRKEKMGDRITALQQLVSPFGKTDTASVLHEAIEYIKFLHDQVNVLSTPYLRNGAAIQRLQNSDKSKEKESKQDLKSRGLCLVPISSTFPVAAENTTDFWIPTFGGTFR